jgi:hypothetical protein
MTSKASSRVAVTYTAKDKLSPEVVRVAKYYGLEALARYRPKLPEPPDPPKPPLNRHLRDGCGWICPKCESSMVRKYIIVGELKCIHPECGFTGRPEYASRG